MQDKLEGNKELAAKYYGMAAELGCQLGLHWLGVFYHLNFGLPKNIEKAIDYLYKAANFGNG